MASVINLYNAALREIGAARLASVSDATKSRYELDDAYTSVVADCLRTGSWNFALRTASFAHDTSVTPDFGYTYAFAKPSDWIKTVMMGAGETFQPEPLTNYLDEKGFWLANVDPLFVQYVSNDSGYGMNLSVWPDAFRRYVEVALADRVCMTLTQDQGMKQNLQERVLPRARRTALNDDAGNEGTKFIPPGSWNKARGFLSSINGTRRGL